ncbi:uncharacterized protein RJT20DRAFT_136410 [Scheffersomyces xylosifermentans]|uniref:uncharacterized protein n=1 Tax=Scheffersomyces xylosifermentans TaxID=1304137 RepID=UPI00315C78D3
MSFYLMPAVSYQTQQKMKDDMRKKGRKHSRHSPAHSRSSGHSSLEKFRSFQGSDSDGPISSTFSIRTRTSSAANSYYDYPSIQEDVVSFQTEESRREYPGGDSDTDTISKRLSVISLSGSMRSDKHKEPVFNYTGNEEIVAYLNQNKPRKMKRKHSYNSKSSASSFMEPLSPSANPDGICGIDSEQNSIKIRFNKSKSPTKSKSSIKSMSTIKSKSPTKSKLSTKSISSPRSIPPPNQEEAFAHTYNSDDPDSPEEMGSELCRVYSDVDSIFSKRKEPKAKVKPPSLKKSHSSNSTEDSFVFEGPEFFEDNRDSSKLSRFKKRFV